MKKKIVKRPNGYWTVEKIIESTQGYKNYTDWRKSETAAVKSITKMNTLDRKLIFNKIKSKFPSKYLPLSKDEVLLISKQFQTKSAFFAKANRAYRFAVKNDFLDEACNHMPTRKKSNPSGYWTVENIIESTKKYKTYKDWFSSEKAAYCSIMQTKNFDKKSILNKIKRMLTTAHKPLSKKEVLLIAKKYKTRNEFSRKASRARAFSIKNGFYEEACRHMPKPIVINSKPNGYWTKERIVKEARKYKTYKEWERGHEYSLKAAKRKGFFDEAGAHLVRAVKLITKDDSILMAKKVNRRIDFQKQYPSYYAHALKKGYLEECCKHMLSTKESSKIGMTKWTKEALIKEALKYSKRAEFQNKASGAYDAARNMNIMNEICSHMTFGNLKWTKEKLRTEALKYKNKLEFSKKNDGSLRAIYMYKYQDELLSHMPTFEEQLTKWTKEKIWMAAKKCKTKKEFSRRFPGAYNRSKKKGFFKELEFLFKKLTQRIEIEVLHPKIDRILSKNKLIKNKDFFYNKIFTINKKRIIPDFIFYKNKKLYIVEAKTCSRFRRTSKDSKLDRQVKEQIESVQKENNNLSIKHILLSELGSISSKESDFSMSLKDLDLFLKKNKIPKKKNISSKEHESLGIKIMKNYKNKILSKSRLIRHSPVSARR